MLGLLPEIGARREERCSDYSCLTQLPYYQISVCLFCHFRQEAGDALYLGGGYSFLADRAVAERLLVGPMSPMLDSGWQGLPRLLSGPAGARRPRRQADWATGGEARRRGRFRLRFGLSRSGRFHHASWLLLDMGVIFRQSLKPCEASRLARVRHRTEQQGHFCPNPHSLDSLQVISLYARVLSETGIFKTFLGWRSSATASAGWKSLRQPRCGK